MPEVITARMCVAAAILVGLLPQGGPAALAAPAGTDAVSVFAQVPDPGAPYGIAIDNGRVYVSTGAGHPGHPTNTNGERIFAFDADGALRSEMKVDMGPVSAMGLYGMTFDAQHRLYVADMNHGTILRANTQPSLGAAVPYSAVPSPYNATGWRAVMWNDVEFDERGNAYVADNHARIWRIRPGHDPEIWFTDPRIVSFASGVLQVRVHDRRLYFTVSATFANPDASSQLYRLPLIDTPQAANLELVHRFPFACCDLPFAQGLAFGASGRTYVGLTGSHEIVVLRPDGTEERRIHSPLLKTPYSMTFLGHDLLVADPGEDANYGQAGGVCNVVVANVPGQAHPEQSRILRIDVGETGAARPAPRISP